MRYLKFIMVITMLAFLTGCFETVPPATKGKILTTSGYSPEILPPGQYTIWGRDQLITLETATKPFKETMTVILADKLTLTFDVRFQTRLKSNPDSLERMFDDIVPQHRHIALENVYATYGRMIVRNQARIVLGKYTVEDVHKNYAQVSKELVLAITPMMANTPLDMTNVSLADIKYPDVVTAGIDRAKAKEIAIGEAQAEAEIALLRKENERRLAEANYEVEITKARAIRDSDKIISEGVTAELIEYRRLEVLSAVGLAAAQSGNATFLPLEGLTNPGSQVRMFNSEDRRNRPQDN